MVRTGLVLPLALGMAIYVPRAEAVAQEAKPDGTAEAATVRVDNQAKAPETAKAKGAKAKDTASVNVVALVKQANPMLWPLAICSIVALGYALERLIALRRGRVIPREFVERFHERLAGGKLDRERAAELCRANESPAARVFGHAVKYWGQPAGAIRQALSFDVAGELADLKRNIRVLNGTATLAPLLGLLGTVVGLIESFDALGGRAGGSANKGEALAHGISLALMTTAFGLAIAIVSVAAYYFLLNRVDVLVRDLDEHAGRVVDLISAESGRPLADRRVGAAPTDYGRHEPFRGAERGARAPE
jgi:biopolymer transport protein ExbB